MRDPTPLLDLLGILAMGAVEARAAARRTGAVRVSRAAQRFQFGAFSFRDPIVLDMRVEPVFDQQGRWLGMVTGYALAKSDESIPTSDSRVY